MEKGSNCDRTSQFSEILTEPLNPRDRGAIILLFKGGGGDFSLLVIFESFHVV